MKDYVLFSIQVCWSSMFVIPQKVLKKKWGVLLLRQAFFLSEPQLKTPVAKVSWDSVCLPTDEEGSWF